MTLTTELREIQRLHDMLLAEALFGGNDGALAAAAPIPGGPAAVVLAPWSFGHNSGAQQPGLLAEQIQQRLDEHSEDMRLTAMHPAVVLASWMLAWREWFGHQTPKARITVRTAVGYLILNADHIETAHGDGAPDRAEMMRDLGGVRAFLEAVVHDVSAEQRSQVPCLDCPGVRLVKRFHPKQTAKDHWLCPRCKRKYTDADHARAKAQHLASQGADRFVPLLDAIHAVRVSPAIVRAWIAQGKLGRKRDETTGQTFVWWPDLRTLDHEHTMRAARRKIRLS